MECLPSIRTHELSQLPYLSGLPLDDPMLEEAQENHTKGLLMQSFVDGFLEAQRSPSPARCKKRKDSDTDLEQIFKKHLIDENDPLMQIVELPTPTVLPTSLPTLLPTITPVIIRLEPSMLQTDSPITVNLPECPETMYSIQVPAKSDCILYVVNRPHLPAGVVTTPSKPRALTVEIPPSRECSFFFKDKHMSALPSPTQPPPTVPNHRLYQSRIGNIQTTNAQPCLPVTAPPPVELTGASKDDPIVIDD